MAFETSDKFYADLIGTQFFLRNTIEDCLIKIEPDGSAFVKFRGRDPFKARDESSVVADAFIERNVVGETEWNIF